MKKLTLPILACAMLFAACNGSSTENKETPTADTTAKATPPPAVELTAVTQSPDFPGATLGVASVKAEKAGDSAKVTFNFIVKNYELKMQTTDNANKQCNNSAQGQHIHFIMDNSPYKALYEPVNEVTLANNSEHYLVAFLSRSYHESIKSKGAAIVYHFSIDKDGKLKKMDDPKTPMIVYSRPKGEYMGTDTTNVLLDYYLLNCDLGTDSYKVKAEIANTEKTTQQLTATLDKWEPRFIKNLGTGKCRVTLTLTDKEGKALDGPQTTVTRDFTLKP